jgi:hypothetical protein
MELVGERLGGRIEQYTREYGRNPGPHITSVNSNESLQWVRNRLQVRREYAVGDFEGTGVVKSFLWILDIVEGR